MSYDCVSETHSLRLNLVICGLVGSQLLGSSNEGLRQRETDRNAARRNSDSLLGGGRGGGS